VDEFLRFLAVTSMVSNLDSFFTIGHNYYLYLDPDSNKFVFIPWDLDLSFAGFPFMASPEQQLDLSLTHPYGGENKLVERLLAIQQVSAQYQKIVKELTASAFAKERLLKNLEAIDKVTREPIERETKAAAARKEGQGGFGFGPPGGMFGRSIDLRTFIEKRTASVNAQVDGKSKGFVPTGFGGPGFGGPGGAPGGGFGGPGGGMGMRPTGEVLPQPLQNMLRLTDEQKRKVAELQKDIDAQIKAILNDEQNKQFQSLRERSPGGFGPPGFGPSGGGPGQPPKGDRP
jgi:hypothetical protein